MRGTRYWSIAARAALLLVLCVAAAEVTVRVVAAHVPGARLLAQPIRAREHDLEDFAAFQSAYANDLVPYRDLNGFRTNSLGFHDVEFRRDFPADGFRVVALGDSFTFGMVPYWYVEMTLVEDMLGSVREQRSDGATPSFEIDNLGVPATGLADYRVLYDFVGRGLHPDLVLVQLYLGNDPLDYADSRLGRARASASRSWLLTFLQRATVLLRERSRGAMMPLEPADPVAAPHTFRDEDRGLTRPIYSDATFAGIMQIELRMLAKPGADPGAPDWNAFRAALDDLIDTVSRDGTGIVLVLTPSRLQVHPDERATIAASAGLAADTIDPDLPNQHVRDIAARRGIPLIDTTDALRHAATTGGRLYLPNDTHWSLRGNAIAANEVAQQLVQQGLVPTGAARSPHAGS